jgi:hypothetical protein
MLPPELLMNLYGTCITADVRGWGENSRNTPLKMQPLTRAFSMNSAHRSESVPFHIGTGPEAWNTIQKTFGAQP